MDHWALKYKGWDPEEQPLREALCTLGNGFFATRGAAEEVPDNEYNYPGTYMAGGYNRMTSRIAGKDIENEDLVNWPNWLFLTFRPANGPWLDLSRVEVLEYHQELNLKNGLLSRKMKIRDGKDRVTSIISRRVVSMNNHHEAGLEWVFIPENWSGRVIFRAGIDGDVINNGVERYRDLEGKHLEIEEKGITEDHIQYLSARTLQSEVKVSMSSRVRLFCEEKECSTERKPVRKKYFAGEDIRVECNMMVPVRVEKLVSVYSSRDFAIADPLTEALEHINRIKDFRSLLDNSQISWEEIWEKCDIKIKNRNGGEEQMIVRLHIFHLFQTVSNNSMGYDIGVPSRGWHGEAYRGHIFWDELYIFPFINMHFPQLARSLLMYRYNRLSRAVHDAREKGCRGCRFPWQSGSNGREESQVIHLNPESGRWIPDNTHLQVHINAAVAFNVWQYYQSTMDIEFLLTYGVDIIMNNALFWSSLAEIDSRKNRYEIRGVVGPDEYHTRYPGSDVPGLHNNAYTNFMAVWVLLRALEIAEMVDNETLMAMQARIGFTEEDLERWEEITRKMFIPFDGNGVIMQFEGFDELEELDWKKYRSEYGDAIRLDRILEKENDSVNRYRACKQADVLMLFYLFSSEELEEVFGRLGYDFKASDIPRNIEYYQAITSHGSTLSRVVHSWVYARVDRNRSWGQLNRALRFDIEDVQGGTTSEGIHLGAMACSVDLVMRGYSGLEIRDDVLWFNPRIPEDLKELSFHVRYRGHWIRMEITQTKLKIDFRKGWAPPVEIGIKGKKILFRGNESKEFDIG